MKTICERESWKIKTSVASHLATGWILVEEIKNESFGFVARLKFIGRYDAAGFPIP